MKTALQPGLSQSEADLLLYLELRLVEHGGEVRSDLMRPEELTLVQAWHESGFLRFEPIRPQDMNHKHGIPATHRVAFSEDAWTAAFQARRRRAP